MIAIEACQMQAIVSSTSWKEGERVTFFPYFLPLLSSVVSIHVIFLQQQAPVDGFWPGLPQYKDFWMFRDK